MSNEELIKALRGVQYVVINTCYGGFGLRIVTTEDKPMAKATGTPKISSSVKLRPSTVSSMMAPPLYREARQRYARLRK